MTEIDYLRWFVASFLVVTGGELRIPDSVFDALPHDMVVVVSYDAEACCNIYQLRPKLEGEVRHTRG